MYKLVCLASAFIILNNCTSQKKVAMQGLNNQLTANEKSSGWKLLFDGKTTSGWHGYGKDDIGSGWKVADGTITLNPDKKIKDRKGSDIVTDEEFGNFDLKLDWK